MSTHHLHEAEKLLDTVPYIDDGRVILHGAIDEAAARFVQVSGAADDVDRVLNRLGSLRELRREDLSLGRRSIIDLGDGGADIDAVAHAAAQVGPVKVTGLTLENAVLTMTTTGETR